MIITACTLLSLLQLIARFNAACSIKRPKMAINGLLGLSMQTLKKQEWTEVSCRNTEYTTRFSVKIYNVYNAKFSV